MHPSFVTKREGSLPNLYVYKVWISNIKKMWMTREVARRSSFLQIVFSVIASSPSTSTLFKTMHRLIDPLHVYVCMSALAHGLYWNKTDIRTCVVGLTCVILLPRKYCNIYTQLGLKLSDFLRQHLSRE